MLEIAEEVVDGEVGVEEVGGAGVEVADGFQFQLDLLGGLVGVGAEGWKRHLIILGASNSKGRLSL